MLANKLVQLRAEQHLLQKDIATRLGISLRSYQRYEEGERKPDADILSCLADIFDVSVDYILGRTDNPMINH